MSAWVKSLGILANIIAPVNMHRNILPIGVKKYDEFLHISWYRGEKEIPDINILGESRNGIDWPTIRGARPGDRSSWYWRWTLEELRDNLTKLIKNKSLPICTEIIFKELMWSTSLKIMKKGSLYTDNISINEIKTKLQKEYKNREIIEVDKKYVPMAMYIDYITDLENRDISVIESPLPGKDINNPKYNWVWSFYSDERLYLRTIKIYEDVIKGYKEIVEVLFPIL